MINTLNLMTRAWLALLISSLVVGAPHALATPIGIVQQQAAQAAPAQDNAGVQATADPATGDPMIIIKSATPSQPPFLYTASADAKVLVQADQIRQTMQLKLRIIQGKPGSVRLGLAGNGEIVSVQGPGIQAWSVRTEGEQRFLDMELVKENPQLEATIEVRTERSETAQLVELLHLTPGKSVGFDSRLTIQYDRGLSGRVLRADGFIRLNLEPAQANVADVQSFQTTTGGRLVLQPVRRGVEAQPVEIEGLTLTGTLDSDSRSMAIVLKGFARVNKAGARFRFLSGQIAPVDLPQTEDYRLRLSIEDQQSWYELEFPRKGRFPIELNLVASVTTPQPNWNGIQFSVVANAVVPVTLNGLDAELEFLNQSQTLVPIWDGQQWQAFLPASGQVNLQWKDARNTGEGKLFFTTLAQIEAKVGPGLLRQDHQLEYNILQGQLKNLTLDLQGPGEILDVAGNHVVGWKILETEDGRRLNISLSQPIEGKSAFLIRSQTALEAFPVRVEGLRIIPQGAIRHSGHLRVSNSGSVRVTPTDLKGLTQMGPEHFPGPALEARQLFVYRFPSADYNFTVVADRIQPEVNISQLVVYALAQAEKIIMADIELDIREAGIRQWSFRVPEDYSIVAVTGAGVADYIVGTEVVDGQRDLKVVFGQDVMGRQLVSLRMEKNESASAGSWELPRIDHPEAKALRGDIGVAGAPGFRISTATTDLLVEKPLSTFPNPVANLQQAFRIRQPLWSATMQIEPLERSVQSDLFHLYSLSQGNIYGSVLVNYYVAGAPTDQWQLSVPEALGNVTVDGRDIRSWRRDGDTLTVNLHQPVMGPYTLLLTFEQKPDETDGSFTAAQVAPIDVQGDRGYVQIVSPLQVEMERLLVSPSLLELDPLELPAEFRLLSTAPSLGTWQYTERPFDLKLRVNWFQPGTTATQIVEFSEARSHVSPDGELVTDVLYWVKSRGQSNLEVQLPEAPVRLWSVSVNDSPVNARQAGTTTLIPLPGAANPNKSVKVSLRLGKPVVEGPFTKLDLPIVLAPVLKTQWKVVADENQVLIPVGGTVEATQPVLWPNGFDWLGKFGLLPLGGITLLVFLASLVGTTRKSSDEPEEGSTSVATSPISGPRSFLTSIISAGALAACIAVGWWSFEQSVPPVPLEMDLPVISQGAAIGLEVQSLPAWQVYFSWLGLGLLVGGFLLVGLIYGLGRAGSLRLLLLIGLGLMGAGCLLQVNGEIWFFALLTLSVLLFQLCPALYRLAISWKQSWQRRQEQRDQRRIQSQSNPETGGGDGATGVVTSILAFLLFSLAGTGVTMADGDFESATSLTQQWNVTRSPARLTASGEMTLTGRPGDQFVVLRAPAIMSNFEGEGLHLSKRMVPDLGMVYLVTIPLPEPETLPGADPTGAAPTEDAPPRPGEATLPAENNVQQYSVKFEYRLDSIAPENGIPVLTGSSALQKLVVHYDQPDWEVLCAAAARIVPVDDPNQTAAELLLRPGAQTVVLRPRARDLSAEETQFFVEGTQLYIPGPGVVDGRHRLSLRTSQGRIADLTVSVPDGLTVSSVQGPVTAWQFDADNHRLNLQLDPSAPTSFDVMIETQRALEPLPTDLQLSPLRVEDADGEVGLIAVAFGSDAQPEKMESEDFSQVNAGDFDNSLLGGTSAVVQRVFRYGALAEDAEPGTLQVRAIPVAPEVRVTSRQVISLGDERMVLGINFVTEISRTGLFQLSFPLPEGLEVESLSGESLHHWSELVEDDQRSIVLHLNGKTIGNQSFSLVLAGSAPTEEGDWNVPRFQLDQAERQSGELLIRPIPGIRLQATERQNLSEIDPRAMGGNAQEPAGTLAFRLLQRDWNLVLNIEKLAPWMTAQVLHEVNLREGQTRSTLLTEVTIENASLRSMLITLPLENEDEIKTIRATGASVSDFVRTDPQGKTWRLQFKRRVIGKVQFQIEYERRGDRVGDTEELKPIDIEDTNQISYYYAVRNGGRLEIEPVNLTQGWQRMDWNMVPPALRGQGGNRGAPALTLRAVAPTTALALKVIRHSLADALKLQVMEGQLTTVLSPNADQLTALDLKIKVIQRSSLEVQLPESAELFSIFVNGESVHSIRQDDDPNGWQFYILPGPNDQTADVRLVYLVTGSEVENLNLISPRLNVPLENVSWNVMAPPGFELTDFDGNLELSGEKTEGQYDRAHYLEQADLKRQQQAQKAAQLLQQASQYLQQGEQSKARWALNSVANQYALDAASNEDARVQLENLQTQQAVVGLNTRRQRFYLDNNKTDLSVGENEQLLQAAAANPILQQDNMNFRPQELSQLLAGNTSEDNAILMQIAGRLVRHQRTTEPAPQAIVISMPQEGQIYQFTRGVQVAEDAPLELQLQFGSSFELRIWQWAVLGSLLGVVGLALTYSWRR